MQEQLSVPRVSFAEPCDQARWPDHGKALAVGASGWNYVTEYRGDVRSSLAALHQEMFDGGESWFRTVLDRWELPQPATLEELWGSEVYHEFMGTHGTHSILDVPGLGPNGISPLDTATIVRLFGSDQPTRADWDRAAGEHAEGVREVLVDRWTGRYVVLFEGDEPVEVAFWGASGD
jgi:hypothetical protein